jgi:hypothetical protein
MNNYENVWGNTNKDWCKIDVKENQLLSGLTALAWLGMLAFAVCCIFAVITKSNVFAGLSVVCLFVWLIGGIPAVRMIRARRRSVVFHK